MFGQERRLFLTVLFSLCMFLMCIATAAADVVYLNDGTIVLATFRSTSGEEMIYKNSSGEIRVLSASIMKTESDFSGIKGRKVSLLLTDKSKIEGLFNDYDEDIGYFIDLSFGTLSVPIAKVIRMIDPQQAERFEGAPISVSARTLFYIPLGSDNFKSLFGGGLGAEFKLPFKRGFFGGADLELLGVSNDQLKDLSYTLIQITPKAVYRYLGFRTMPGSFSHMVPFAALGGGFTIVLIKDQRSGVYPDKYGSLSPHIKAELGVDYSVSDDWSIKINGAYVAVFQDQGLFNMVGGNLSVCYEF